jgi:hypothetical protein
MSVTLLAQMHRIACASTRFFRRASYHGSSCKFETSPEAPPAIPVRHWRSMAKLLGARILFGMTMLNLTDGAATAYKKRSSSWRRYTTAKINLRPLAAGYRPRNCGRHVPRVYVRSGCLIVHFCHVSADAIVFHGMALAKNIVRSGDDLRLIPLR